MATHVLSLNTDYIIKVLGVKNSDGNALTGATVQVTLLESDESTEVTGVTWPVTLDDDGDGNYSGNLSRDVEIDELLEYSLKVVITASSVSREYVDNVYIDGNGSP